MQHFSKFKSNTHVLNFKNTVSMKWGKKTGMCFKICVVC